MQKAVHQNKIDKSFNITNIDKEFCLLYGETAEAYEAWRKQKPDLGEELADIAIYLLGLSEILDIDLQDEIIKKMQINQNRKYETINGVNTRIDWTVNPAAGKQRLDFFWLVISENKKLLTDNASARSFQRW